MRFRKKPVVIDAWPWSGKDGAVDQFRGLSSSCDVRQEGKELVIRTLEGEMRAQPGDHVIRGVQGELYPCKPDIFEQTYERV
jgi:hypothetical protein